MKLEELKSFPKRERAVLRQGHWIDDRAALFANDNASCILVSGNYVQFFCTMVSEDTTWIKIALQDFITCSTKEKVIKYWQKKKSEETDHKQMIIATELLEDLMEEENENN